MTTRNLRPIVLATPALALAVAALVGGSRSTTPATAGEECLPDPIGQGCLQAPCPPGEECRPKCVNYDPSTGQTVVIECVCVDPENCHLEIGGPPVPPCVQPDNGTGTVDLPPLGCAYENTGDVWRIIDGLPPGTTLEFDGTLFELECNDPPCSEDLPPEKCETPGGSLNGDAHCFRGTLHFDVHGTGELQGFTRTLHVPVWAAEVHTGPRNPGDPVQSFDTQLMRLQGELFGDPDFCTLRVRAGLELGMPGPGHTTLTRLPDGDFAVDSFFDITYQIEFEGCPDSQLADLAGTTLGNVRIDAGGSAAECVGACPPGEVCTRVETVNADGTIDICCECRPEQPVVCEPAPGGQSCVPVECPDPDHECVPTCVRVDPATGATVILECECRNPDECGLDIHATGPPCVAPDNGTGTVTLPPLDCVYDDIEDNWRIIDGLPPGTTIELDATLQDLDCDPGHPPLPAGCPPPLQCEMPGGTLGGDRHCFGANLVFDVSGTGSLAGFTRHLSVPVVLQVDTAPRTPGDPVQVFSADLRVLTGELFGDPDFCTFRVIGGTDFGLPSPGITTLTDLPTGDFAVDSFFDITYQIEFEGCPGSQLEDYAGTTTATIRMATGGLGVQCVGNCPPDSDCREAIVLNADGTIDVCCVCVTDFECQPDPTAFGCLPVPCPDPEHECLPVCMAYDPIDGIAWITACECRDPTLCHLRPAPLGPPCVAADSAGTAELPPPGCEYLSPDDVWRITDGLPPGSVILFDAVLRDFNKDYSASGPGGSLGGEVEVYTATLFMPMTGTGALAGFNRNIALTVDVETHSGPRSPGDPVQSFDTDMFSMQRELFGDPDFCTFRLTAGTGHNLPSPGETTLVKLPSGDWAIDSFFDVTYRIEWEGCPGGSLEDLAGVTTATVRMRTGGPGAECVGPCPPRHACKELIVVHPDGAIEICCECVHCPGDTNGDGTVNVDDLVNVIVLWGTSGFGENPPGTPVEADVTDNTGVGPPDGTVDVNDLNAVILNWGPC